MKRKLTLSKALEWLGSRDGLYLYNNGEEWVVADELLGESDRGIRGTGPSPLRAIIQARAYAVTKALDASERQGAP